MTSKICETAPTGLVSMETTLDRTSTLLSLNSRLIAKGNISIQQQVLEKKKEQILELVLESESIYYLRGR